MPAGLRGYDVDQANGQEADIGTCILLSLPELQVHLRTNEYYMGRSIDHFERLWQLNLLVRARSERGHNYW